MNLKIFLEEQNPILTEGCLSNEERLRLIKVYDSLKDKPEGFDDYLLEHTSPETIDFVIPYTDFTDPCWKKEFNKTLENLKINTSDLKNNDDMDNEETLKLVFRGIEKYVPWVGIIHFIVKYPSQIPEWLDISKVHIVYHKDFIPAGFLPTFNKNTVDTFLFRVIGLSEKFIKRDPNIYFLGDLKPTHFFIDGKPIIDFYFKDAWEDVPATIPIERLVEYNLKLAENLTNGKLLKKINRIKIHGLTYKLYPFCKSCCKSIYETHKNFIAYELQPMELKESWFSAHILLILISLIEGYSTRVLTAYPNFYYTDEDYAISSKRILKFLETHFFENFYKVIYYRTSYLRDRLYVLKELGDRVPNISKYERN